MAVDSRTGDVFVAESGEDRVTVFVPEEASGAPVVDQRFRAGAFGEPRRGYRRRSTRAGRAERIRVPVRHGRTARASRRRAYRPVPPGQISAGFGDQGVSVTLDGLQPQRAYYYRVLASNALGRYRRRSSSG